MLRAALPLLCIVVPAAAQPPRLEWIQSDDGRLEAVLRPVLETREGVPADWSASLTAHIGDCSVAARTPAMFASVSVMDDGVYLRPRFGLDPAERYCAVFDGARLGQSGGRSRTTRLTAQWERRSDSEPVRVARVVPTVATLPANALRLYIEFSRPVFPRDVHTWIELWDETIGAPVETPFVDIPEGLWDRAQQRLTLLFHPGRVKREVGPNRTLGAPLTVGHRYRLIIEPADGETASMRFAAIEADRAAVEPDRWRLWPPERATGELRVDFGEALDPYLVKRWVWIESADGQAVAVEVTVDRAAMAATFVPIDRWPPGVLELVVDPRLEDLAGNRIGRVFDREVDDARPPAASATAPDPIRIPIVRGHD